MRKEKNVRLCKTCGITFTPISEKQVFCSKQCRDGWRYIQKLREKELEDQENAIAMEKWHTKEEQGLKVSVCKNCLAFSWKKQPTDFCSRGCEVVYKGN